MDVIMRNPRLDYTVANPMSQQARQVAFDLEHQYKRTKITALSKEFGLFFFFSSRCAYCYQFAPIVQAFAQKYDWKVRAISVDGGQIAGFESVQRDNGMAQHWGVEVLPSLFAINPRTQEVIPVAHGLIALDEIESRILFLTEQRRKGPS
jgi:conjugal transfer pilus assembly protein TraF